MPIPSTVTLTKQVKQNGHISVKNSSEDLQQVTEVNPIQSNQELDQVYIKKSHGLLSARRDENDIMVNLSEQRLDPLFKSSLYPGSQFQGYQKCGTVSYEVNVDIKYVDIKDSTLCGYLKIKGLTAEFPELTTFFHAEIIGSKHSFHTRKWHADQQSDLLHWSKFPSFKPHIDTFNEDTYTMAENDDFIYMRWKEDFLVPDHRVDSIHGASYAGFYYICYQRSTHTIKGFYFYRHHKDWFQELSLNHVPERSFGSFEFC